MSKFVVCSALFVSLAACQTAPKVDVAGEAQSLLAVDRAWSAAVAGGASVDSMVSYWTDDARLALPGEPMLVGKAALTGMVKGMMAMPGFKISWTPDSAVVAQSGDFGYTFGSNSTTMPDPKGKPVTEIGRYITVWRKGADGRWRCVMDYGNAAPAVKAGG
jgi:ketosteroid isomerase-like protein